MAKRNYIEEFRGDGTWHDNLLLNCSGKNNFFPYMFNFAVSVIIAK